MKRIGWLILAVGSLALAQQPQTQTAPIYSVNAKYTNGVAPGYAPTASSALTLNLGGGTANCSGTIVTYAAGTLAMTASATNYVYLDTSANCVPAVKTSAFTASDIPIAQVVAGASSITSISDVRTPFNKPSSGGGSGTVSGQAAGVVPLGTSATVIGNRSHIDDGVTVSGDVTVSEPVNITASGPSQTSYTYNATPLVPGSSTTAVYGVESAGRAVVSEAGGAASEVCTAANGVCAGTGGAVVNVTDSLTATGCTISGGVCTVGATTAAITLSGIPTTYKDLQITFSGTNNTTAQHMVALQFDGDTGSNYYGSAACASTGCVPSTGGTTAGPDALACVTGGTGLTGGGVITIPNYAGSTGKHLTGLCDGQGSSGGEATWFVGGKWTGTSAITSITFILSAGSYEAGDTIIVRGVN